MEALEAGSRLLLLDEDTSATNFMVRDARMQALVAKEHEPITPFADRVRELWETARRLDGARDGRLRRLPRSGRYGDRDEVVPAPRADRGGARRRARAPDRPKGRGDRALGAAGAAIAGAGQPRRLARPARGPHRRARPRARVRRGAHRSARARAAPRRRARRAPSGTCSSSRGAASSTDERASTRSSTPSTRSSTSGASTSSTRSPSARPATRAITRARAASRCRRAPRR